MTKQLLRSLSIFVLAALGAIGQTNKPLNNDQLIDLVKAGFDQETLVKLVEANGSGLDTSVQGLLALKNGGVSQKVIAAALAGKTKVEAPQRPAEQEGIPEEVGVYVKIKGQLTPIEPEITNARSGWAKVNGSVKNAHSPTQLTGDVIFVIRASEGVSAAEYQLVKLDVKSDRREFRILSAGGWHASTGADRATVPFKFDRIASRTFQIALKALAPGEYAFLPPGAAVSANAAAVGKVYSFGFKE